jgi:hypothetical protein
VVLFNPAVVTDRGPAVNDCMRANVTVCTDHCVDVSEKRLAPVIYYSPDPANFDPPAPLVGNSFEQKLQQAAGGRQAVGKFVLGEDAD